MLDNKELRTLDEKSLNIKAQELNKELFELRFQKATSGVEKPHKFKEIRKDIARVKTAINEKTK